MENPRPLFTGGGGDIYNKTRPRPELGEELLGGHGAAKVIALKAVAAQAFQQLALLFCLDALGDAAQAQLVAQVDEGADDGLLPGAVARFRDQAPVNFHQVQLGQIEHLQAGALRAHVVHGHGDAPGFQGVQAVLDALQLQSPGGLGHLENELAVVHAGALQNVIDAV